MPSHTGTISLDDEYDPDAYAEDGDGDHDGREGREGRDHDDEDRDSRPHKKRPRQRREIPAHAPRPQDHKRPEKTAAQREAEGVETVDVEYDGEVYTIPAEPLDWDLDVTLAFEQNRVVTAIRALLPPAQWKALYAKGYKNRDFQKLFDRLAKAGGFRSTGN